MRTNEELAMEIQAGNYQLIDRLWKQCYNFICQQANRWARAWRGRSDFDADDLIQVGYIAMCDAVQAYQKDRGSFINFLTFYLKKEFSNVAGCRYEAQSKEPLNNAISLDSLAYNDDESETTIGDTIPIDETGYEKIDDSIYNNYVLGVVKEAVNSLPEKQCAAVSAHYLDGKTYGEIASKTSVSIARVGQLVKSGLKGLRNGSHAPILSELLYGDRDYYLHTGYRAWKETGCSSQEWSVLWQERTERNISFAYTREDKIQYCIDRLGMDRVKAESIFPA